MKQNNENASRPGGAGRKPKADPAVFRYSISFNAIDHARFLALFDQSGMRTKAHFITARIFGEPFKVIKIDKAAVEYYTRLTALYSQFRGIAVNYNQVVKIPIFQRRKLSLFSINWKRQRWNLPT